MRKTLNLVIILGLILTLGCKKNGTSSSENSYMVSGVEIKPNKVLKDLSNGYISITPDNGTIGDIDLVINFAGMTGQAVEGTWNIGGAATVQYTKNNSTTYVDMGPATHTTTLKIINSKINLVATNVWLHNTTNFDDSISMSWNLTQTN
jgi:hypothetical protein